MIQKVKLSNWRSHLDSEMEFGEGTNALIGIMGSGKSSVLSGISFALFGTFPSLRSREVTLDGVIMERPQKKEEASVEVQFTVDGSKFHVKREIKRGRGTTEAEIRKDGELLDTGASRVTELVEKYLKINYELFSRAVYSEQDGLDYFLEIPKGKRMKRIDNLLKIDRFEECRSNTTTAINRLEDKIQSKEEVVNEMEEEQDFGKIEKLEEEIKDIEEDIDQKKSKLEDIDEKYNEIQEELKKLKEGIEEIKKLEKRKNNIEGVISNIEEEIDRVEGDIELSEDELKNKIEQIEEEITELEDEKEDLEKRKERVSKERQKKTVKIKDIQKRIQKLKDVEGTCPVCDSKLTEEHKQNLLQKRRERITELSESKEEKEETEEEIREDIETIDERISEKKENKEELEKKVRKIEELDTKKEKLEEKEEKLENINKEINEKEQKFDQEKIENRQETLQELSGEKSELETEIKSDRKFVENKEDRLEELQDKKETFERYREEIKKSKKLDEDLKKFRNALKSTQKRLRQRFINAVNNTLSKVWGDLYPYDDFSGVRLTIKEDDYELQLRSDGNWHPVEGIASGGERTTACLALRIAFALVLAPNLRWLVLDEPTHNLDQKTVRDLAHLLRTSVSEFVNQVFLITHDENLEGAVNSHLYKLDRNKEENEPTKIERVETVESVQS